MRNRLFIGVFVAVVLFLVVTTASDLYAQYQVKAPMKVSLKWLTVPFTNDTKQVETVQLWQVRWMSRYDEYSFATRPEMEAFTSEVEADAFALSLKRAFDLIKHTSGNYVTVQKAQ